MNIDTAQKESREVLKFAMKSGDALEQARSLVKDAISHAQGLHSCAMALANNFPGFNIEKDYYLNGALRAREALMWVTDGAMVNHGIEKNI